MSMLTGPMAVLTAAAEAEEPSPLLPHLSELIVGLVAFGLLFYFLRAYVFPIFEKTYAERSSAIEGGIKRAEEAQAEAQRALEQYRAQLADARGEAARAGRRARRADAGLEPAGLCGVRRTRRRRGRPRQRRGSHDRRLPVRLRRVAPRAARRTPCAHRPRPQRGGPGRTGPDAGR